ncbi:MAG: class II aldolase/adducin family protein [Spirochaetaceae bacterium]|nr:class II aldolase/adducin family protein [Spirochaetaceae bacterium]
MNINEAKQQVISACHELVGKGLVARTWGNVSCRIDDTHMALTPSGVSYERLNNDNIVVIDIDTLQYEGSVKPSSEKRIHAAVYRHFPEAGFVVHTHQTYATMVSVAGYKELTQRRKDAKSFDVALASYGLPGTKKLSSAVEDALGRGRDILMERHGVLTWGATQDEAIERALRLEELCRGFVDEVVSTGSTTGKQSVVELVETTKPVFIPAMLDDFAQIAGFRMQPGVLPPAKVPGDEEAIRILAEKNTLAYKYAACFGKVKGLPFIDVALMRFVYLKKYSKRY